MKPDNRLSYSAAESLEELRDILSAVNSQSTSKHDVIVTFLYSDYIEVIFQCMVEFSYRNIDDQIRALRKLGDLADYIVEHTNTTGFFLHKGKRTIKTGKEVTSPTIES